ncbi:glycosyltransferase [Desulfurobacterium thermolithotrophum]|uniref:glycosyltransferase n=1 Tax=Desulfurobacterium thermolithotrophum TaxID=64160 RepID=UPI0013D139E7|nr:glycosyltransferase [Desulfurobacterium thermolithotrophum]
MFEQKEFHQVESYLQLQQILDFRFPVNFTRGWAASPDFLLVSIKEILKFEKQKKEIIIVEAGSGVSTVVIGYLLKKFFPKGILISLEHEYDFYKKTLEELKLHELNNVKLLYTPLISYWIKNKEWLWYDTSCLNNLLGNRKIDVLFIDGPPEIIQKDARYPALPLLRKFLSEKFLLLLDDANREGERNASYEWKKELEIYESETVQTEKGTLIIKKISVKEKPFFSICIPTYNRANYLKEAIESILRQTYSNFEVIIYDDGSTDDTERIVKNFNDKRIKYIKGKVNQGRPFARNKCIDLAKGNWIVWLDDDDKMEPELLSFYAVNINRFPEVSVFYPKYIKAFYEKKHSIQFITISDFYKNHSNLIRTLIRKPPIPNPGVCLKKKIYSLFGKYNEEFLRAQDYELWLRVLPHVEVKGIDYVGILYRIHSNNVSTNTLTMDYSYESFAKRRFLSNSSLEEIYKFSPENSLKLFADDLLVHDDYFNATYYLWIGNFREESKVVARKAGLYVKPDSRFIKLHRKFFHFLESKNLSAAAAISPKLGKFYEFLANALLLLNEKPKFSLASFKRAALINPIFDFSYLIPSKWTEEIKSVKKRILIEANSLEKEKKNFISFMEKNYEDLCLYHSEK